MTLEETLSNIRQLVSDYDSMPLTDTRKQSDILRSLSCNLFHLEKFRVDAKEAWNSAYSNHHGTGAAKERYADREVQERYLIRRTMTGGYKVLESIRSTIGVYKKEQ